VVQRHPFWWLKLGDFGVSKAVADGLRTRVGTRAYMAPELIDAKIGKYTSAVDMWSLGCVVYWVLTQAIPFPSFGVTSTSDLIKDEKKFPIEALREKKVSEDGIQFLQNLIVANPSSRLSASKALEHTWLRKLQKWGCELEQKARQRDIPEVR
jgi:serine/threonine protein kinase